jgi:hypothetical protein
MNFFSFVFCPWNKIVNIEDCQETSGVMESIENTLLDSLINYRS